MRLVVPPISSGLKRFMLVSADTTQNTASPTASCATISSPVADEVLDDRAERRLVELDGRARTSDPQLGLDAVHPVRLPSSSVLGGPHPSDGLSSSEIVT